MFLNDKEFDLNKHIQSLTKEHDISYIDAIVHFCEEHDIEIEAVASELKKSQRIVSQLQIEAENLNYLPKISRLEF